MVALANPELQGRKKELRFAPNAVSEQEETLLIFISFPLLQ